MSIDPDGILENAKHARCQELISAEDFGNLSSSMDDSQDSCRLNSALIDYHQSSASTSNRANGCSSKDPIEDVIKSTRSFIESDAFNTITKDKVTVNWGREKMLILCSKEKHYALMSTEDQALARGRVSSMDLVLMASKNFPLAVVFEHAMREIVQARRNINSSHYGICPAVHVVRFANQITQCRISSIVPGGEVFPRAERYIHERLEQANLPEVSENDRIELAIFQLCRVLDVLSVCDLRSQTPVDRSILIFAICRLILDRNTCCALQYRASLAIENILNASGLTKHITLVEFSSIFPLISDDLVNLQLCHEIIRLSNVDPTCCLSLFSSTLIHLSERAECEPSDLARRYNLAKIIYRHPPERHANRYITAYLVKPFPFYELRHDSVLNAAAEKVDLLSA
uniref:Uncharacterized protein n=1 Tax=Angiostrongylus cantonensis TaxID=6313 RepID=A0A0K0D243_ANGCA